MGAGSWAGTKYLVIPGPGSVLARGAFLEAPPSRERRALMFDESGHCPTIEEPDRFNRAVGEFVESL